MIRIQRAGLGQTQEECIRDIQGKLFAKGYGSFVMVTGTWNELTSFALRYLYGTSWDRDPGGPCAIARRLDSAPDANEAYKKALFAPDAPPIAQPSSYRPPAAPPMAPPSSFPSPMLIVGGVAALLAVVLLARKP